ncbi:hypothetical protein BDV26DRAFT_253322 [Aspergillus bertholletiae]|uniref:Uncharacterized protein n=1 Tax=Aspergillus bertholletiae TaxID=1226010 RepID=A0A5N7BLE0_9EURO|nr:hypothetical protein BDV26DRAFT_253322 [Aspergillus bertholletiae]
MRRPYVDSFNQIGISVQHGQSWPRFCLNPSISCGNLDLKLCLHRTKKLGCIAASVVMVLPPSLSVCIYIDTYYYTASRRVAFIKA